ncbi:MAG: hypothetical protein ABIO70_17625 [Pseudomonadota bacterium]
MTRTFPLAALAALLTGCPDQNVSAVNAKPEATITSHEDGDAVDEGETVTFWGVISDPDHQTSSLLASWYLGGEKVCSASAPNSDGMTSCEAQVGLDDTSVSLEVVDPKGAAGAAVVTLVVNPTDAPSASILSPLSTGVYYADQLVTFEGLVSDTEDAPDALTAWWESSLDGQLAVTSVPDSSGEVRGTGYLAQGEHAITLHAQDTTGKTGTDSVIVEVGPANSAPSCAITAPESGGAGAEGALVTFEALVSDPDVPADWLQVTWSSDKDGTLGQSSPDSDGSVGFPWSSLSVATHVISLRVEDEVGATCTDSIYYTVGTPPSVTLSAPTSGDVYDEGESITFSALVSDGEDRPSDLTLSWASDVDGVFSTEGADSSGLAELGYAGLSAGAHTLTLTVTDTDGFYATARRSFTVNALPTAPTVTISPDPATSADDLVASASGSVDPDASGTVTYRYAWYEAGALSSASTSALFPASATTRGLAYRVVVTPSDDHGDGAPGEATITISNAAPLIATPSITPSTGVTSSSTLTCSATATDADGDSIAITYAWQNTATSTSLGTGASLTLTPAIATSGDSITCTATADDGHGGTDSDSASVSVSNADPVVSSVGISPSSGVVTSSALTCSAGASDPDGDATTLSYAWTDATTSTSLGSGTTLTLTPSTCSPGDSIACTVTASDGHGGSGTGSASVTVQNTAPVITAVSISPSTGITTASTLTCSATASDADGGSPTLSYAWRNGSTSLGTGASLTLTTATATTGDTITCTATATDADGGTGSDAASVRVEGAAPSITSVTISPDPAFAGDLLTCAYAGFSDPDGDPDHSTLAWTIGGVAAGTGATLATGFSRGDTVTCTVTPSDGSTSGTPVSDSLVISNTPPVLDDVTLSPSPIYEGDTFSCTVGTWADLDGDSVTFAYAWDVDGVDPGVTTATLPCAYFDRDEDVSCTVTPSDGTDAGSPVVSNIITVSNTAPSISAVSISPASPVAGDTLTCSYTGYSDADGDADASTYAWTVGGTAAGSGATLTSGFSSGDSVRCTITPHDGTTAGTARSASVTVGNSPPVVASVSISPSTLYTDSTATAVVSASDPDGDSVTLSYTWTVAGSVVSATSSTLSGATWFDKGETVLVTVTPSDGTTSGTAVSSATLTVQNSAPTAPTVAINPADPTDEDDLVCAVTGAATDADGDTLTYTVSWAVGGAAWSGSTSTTTLAGDTIAAADTTAGDLWTCTVTPNDGSVDGPSGSASATVSSGLDELWQGVTLRLGDADWGFVGENMSDVSGYSVSSAGDVDGDGLDDILIGAGGSDDGGTDAGKAYLVLGSSLGSTQTLDLSTADYVFVGEVASDNAGCSVASAGDVDGDGLDDILIGAPYNDDGGSYAGKAYLVLGSSLGSTTTIDLSAADYAFVGENASDYAGWSVATAGDVDGDGLDDFLIGAPFNDDGGEAAGTAYLILGSSLGSTGAIDLSSADYAFVGENAGDYAGFPVANAGDVDGDGLADVLIGARGNSDGGSQAGKAYLILGDRLLSTHMIDLSTADGAFVGEAVSDYAGYSVASAGDVDKDGLDDILIGAPYNDDGGSYAGKAYVVLATNLPPSGTTSYLADADYTFVGASAGDYAGFSVAPARDVDGDGYADFLISAFHNDDAASAAGKVYLFLNAWLPASGEVEFGDWCAFAGEAASDYAGYSVASAGDVDGDGLDDILIGALYNDEGASNAGKTYLVTWPTIVAHAPEPDLHDTPYRFSGVSASDQAGYAVSPAGDVDGDGLGDVLVGAPGTSSDTGRAYVALGASLTLGDTSLASADFALTGEAAGDFAGFSLSGAGDTDGDALDDLLIGAYGNDDSGVDAGAAYLVAGADLTSSALGLNHATCELMGESAYDYAGYAVSAAGDVDGDGAPDLLVGALYNDEVSGNAGKVYLVMAADLSGYGSSEPLGNAHDEFLGESLNDFAGCAVSTAGDVDGDGYDDLLIGAEGDDDGGTNAGRAYLVRAADLSSSGGSSSLGAAYHGFTGEAARDYAGDAVSSAGDVDGDGYDDLLIGAPENDAAGADAGKAYVVLGASLGSSGSMSLSGADVIIVGAAAGDTTGRSVADAGDVDGDNLGDILVGAPGNDTEGSDAGLTYLIFGATLRTAGASLDMGAAEYDYAFLGDDAGHYAGFATSGAGDVDGDGYDDMLFGAYGYGSETGRVYLWPAPGE